MQPTKTICSLCGLSYDQFRTNLTYSEVQNLFWSTDTDTQTWKYKRRNTVLGKWHQIKLELWAGHLKDCKSAETKPQSIVEY